MLIRSMYGGWKRIECDAIVTPQHVENHIPDWKRLGYPNFDLWLEAWGQSLHYQGSAVPYFAG